MNTYKITQPATTVVLGEYQANSEENALLKLAIDAGYNSVQEMDSVSGNSCELEVSVETEP